MKAALDNFRRLFDHSSDLVQIVGLDGTPLYSNPTWGRVLGYSSETVFCEAAEAPPSPSIFDVIHAEDSDFYRQICAGLQTHGGGQTLSLRLLTCAGLVVPVTGQVCLMSAETPQFWCLWQRDPCPTDCTLRQVEERYSLATRAARVGVWEWHIQTGAFYLDPNVKAILGYGDSEIPNDLNQWVNYVHPDDREAVMAAVQAHLEGQTSEYVYEHRMLHKDGRIRWILVRGQAIRDSQGQVVRMVGTDTDITEHKQTQILLELQNRILARISASEPLTDILMELMEAIEAQLDGALSSILFVDATGTLMPAAAPSLPKSYSQAIASAHIKFGEGVGSCGTAVFRQQPVITSDIDQDPLWRDFKTLALEHGLRACWSVPIIAKNSQVLGTFAVYYPAVRSPQASELEVIHLAANIARIAIERQQTEAALQASEAQNRAILSAIPDILAIVSAEGRILRFSANAFAGKVLPAEIGAHVSAVLPPGTVVRQLTAIQTALSTGEIQRYEQQIQWDDQVQYEEIRIVPYQPDAVLCMIRNVSDRKQAELQLQHLNQELEAKVEQRTAELRDSEERFRSLYEQSPLGISIVGLDGRLLQVNEQFCDIMGYAGSELVGRHFSSLIHPADRSLCLETFQCLARGEQFQEVMEKRYITRTGEPVWVQSTKALLCNRQGQPVGVISMVQDISARKQAEEELKQAKAEAEAANQAKSIFLANMSHELRTPLNGILGFSQLMQQSPHLPSDFRDCLNVIQNNGHYLLRLINDILDKSKIEAGKITLDNQPTDLFSQIQHICQTLSEPASRKNLLLQLDILPGVPRYIEVDAQKLEQVLLNLLSNAIKFTHQGEIRLRVSLSDGSTGQTTTILRFEVEDSGIGIAHQDFSIIFDAFTQTTAGKQSQDGTGLGLSISRRLVQLMGGDISVHSSLGEGSTFVFTIPVGVVAEEEISGSVGNLQVVGLLSNPSDYRVLIVDDQAENRLLLAKLLRQIGLDSREAASGEVALEIWQQWQPHLIWMDIRLPGLSGYDVTQHIRAQEHQRNGLDHTEHLLSSAVGYPKSSSPTVIIAVTAQAFPEDRALALAAGCDDYISKPYRIETLLRKMAEHLGMQLVYAEDKPEDDPSRLSTSHLAVAKPALTMDDLVVMPKAWLIDLQKASQLGREEAVKALIHQIPREQVGLIDKLQALIYDFEFGVIADVAEWCLQCQSMPEGPES